MLLDIDTFCRWVEGDVNGLVGQLQQSTGRTGDWEARVWEQSLPRLSTLLSSSRLEGFHISLGEQGSVAIEYRLPLSASWCDAVLLGRSASQPVALILEMKDWDVTLDKSGPVESLAVQGRASSLSSLDGAIETSINRRAPT